jgi:putative peptidoglycan lipid II flippase
MTLKTPQVTSESLNTGRRALVLDSLATGVGLFTAKAISLVRDIVIAAVFGASSQTDALQVAMQAPMLLDNLVASTAATSALMPSVIALLQQGDHSRLVRLFRNVSTLIFLVSGSIAVIAVLGASVVARLLAGGLSPETQMLTARLLAIALLAAPLMGLSSVTGAVLYAYGRFLLPALSLSLGGVAVIAMTLIFGHTVGVYAPAAGVLIGMTLVVLVQYLALRHLGVTYVPFLKLHDPDLKLVLVLFFPLWISGIVTALSPAVDNLVASYLSAGGISTLRYALNLTVPIMTGVTAVSLAAFPMLTKMGVTDNRSKLADTLLQVSRILTVGLVGITAWLIFMRHPFVSIILQHGTFDADATLRTSQVLGAYALGLPFAGLYYFLIRGLFALSQNRSVLVISVVSLFVNATLDLIFAHLFGLVGIALSSACVQFITVVLGGLALHRQLQNSRFLYNLWRPILVSLLAAGVSYVVANVVLARMLSSQLESWIGFLTAQVILISLYMALMWRLELHDIVMKDLIPRFLSKKP